jgi:hypothetical protein
MSKDKQETNSEPQQCPGCGRSVNSATGWCGPCEAAHRAARTVDDLDRKYGPAGLPGTRGTWDEGVFD